jgi:hypothetical protein
MKKILFALVFIFNCLGAHAQLGYWGNSGFVELTPDESFVYKFVIAMDNESQQAINDLYASMKKTGDKSILKCTEISKGAWYVEKDFPLPEGNYFESAFYEGSFPNNSHENELMVILPQVQSFLNNRGRIEDILEYLGDRVTVDVISESDESGSVDFRFISNLKTSEEWLELCLDVYNQGFDGLHYFVPQHLMINRSSCSHLISVMTDANEDENLIYSMNWEGVEYPAGCYNPDDPKKTDEGLAIVNPKMQEFAGDGSNTIYIGTGGFSLEENHDYIVRLTMKVPSDGKYVVNLGNWFTNYSLEVPVSASDDFQVIDVPFSDFWGDITDREFKPIEGDARVNLCTGWVVGTTVVKKVEVYEVLGSSARGGTTAIDAVKAADADGIIYNLAGQKVDASYKGIVIQNGKKRIVR